LRSIRAEERLAIRTTCSSCFATGAELVRFAEGGGDPANQESFWLKFNGRNFLAQLVEQLPGCDGWFWSLNVAIGAETTDPLSAPTCV